MIGTLASFCEQLSKAKVPEMTLMEAHGPSFGFVMMCVYITYLPYVLRFPLEALT